MSMVKCKGCKDSKVSEHDTLEGYCMLCASKRVGGYDCQAKRIKELEAEIQEVANQLMDLYELCSETTEPAVFGTILGLHERLDKALEG